MAASQNDTTVHRVWEAISGLYRIATGAEISPDQAVDYFRDPAALVDLVRSSGAMEEPAKARAVRRLVTGIELQVPGGRFDGI